MNRPGKPKPPPPPPEPVALGDDPGFGEATFARGLKAVTEAIEQVAREQGVHEPEPPEPPPAAKRPRPASPPAKPIKKR